MDRIHVTVRARPLPPEDAQSSPWRISGNAVALTAQPSIRFEFDRIFGEDCHTADVYGARTKHIVDSAVQGFNGTVFAYGQTNSGKTYTMRGSANEPGIIPLAVHDLFRTIQQHMDREFLVRMSYMEIYNEEINDLLVPEHRKLQIHENYERGIYVAGLSEEIVTCPEQVLKFVSFGESHRHIGETNMNVYSSRSHTIFRMVIESRDKADDSDTDSCDAVRVSVLNLVDLAGSERAAKTGAEGVRLKEGSHINKSLMTLGTVIKKLSEGIKGQGGHVPYRDSKLTRILQPALGGNANTAIICNITLAQVHADETKSSLQFASRALRVTNCAEINEILTDAALLKRQRKEIEELRAKLKSELEKERIALELEEERKAKEQREKRLLQQAKKIENLSSLVLNSERDDRAIVSSKNKRRQTWCARPLSNEFSVEVQEPASEQGSASSSVRDERNMGMPPCFEELMQESYASNVEPSAHGYSFSDLSNEDVSLPDAHALLHVTSRRKPNTMKKSDQEQLRGSVPELPQDPNEQKDAMLSQEPSGLSARESEAILVIKQLQDQVNSLELEKSLIQNNLDDVLEVATQQKASFTEKYEELQKNALALQEEAKIAGEKLSALATIAKSKQELADEFLSNVSMETQGISVQMDQTTHSVDNAISFIEELFQSLSAIAENVTEFKQSSYGHIKQSSYMIMDHEKMSKTLMEKISRLELEKDCILQHELEKDNILSELLTLQKEVLTLSSSSLMKEKESIRKELERTKTKLRETDNKLKNYVQEKIKLEVLFCTQ
uniref:Kinesin-like protein n=1 Tax=Aegilops tauschii subsp. strangulata TaxID=200361 RepID=A0A453KWW6_AEGTS